MSVFGNGSCFFRPKDRLDSEETLAENVASMLERL
jgi:hypothetical protein